MISRRSLLVALAGSVTLSFPATAQSVWKTYRNARLGTTIEYPADRFIPTPVPENSDGQRFIATDGAEFTVAAINNVFNQNLAGLETSVQCASLFHEHRAGIGSAQVGRGSRSLDSHRSGCHAWQRNWRYCPFQLEKLPTNHSTGGSR